MATTPARRVLAVVLAASLLAGCVSTQLPPISSTGAAFEPLADEVELWQQARDEEEVLLADAELYDDPLLEAYLDEVVERLNPRSMADNLQIAYRVRVLADPTLNAFAYPHGSLYVHSGLLARLDNEDQLATVLGHEMSHVEYRHMLRHRRAAQNRAVALGVASVAAAVVLANEEGEAIEHGHWGRAAAIDAFGNLVVGLGLQLAFLAAVNGYGRDLELEADRHGFDKLAAAGYRPAEAPRMYQTLLAEADGDRGRVENFFFGSHPQLSDRVANAQAFAAEQGARTAGVAVPEDTAAGGEDGAAAGEEMAVEARFRARLRPVVRDNAGLNLAIGRFDLAEKDLLRVAEWMPEDPLTHLWLGRLRLAQATQPGEDGPERRTEAVRELREAIRLDADLPEPHRELGLLLHEEGDARGACRELGFYLELAGDADDVPRVRDYVRELRRDGACER